MSETKYTELDELGTSASETASQHPGDEGDPESDALNVIKWIVVSMVTVSVFTLVLFFLSHIAEADSMCGSIHNMQAMRGTNYFCFIVLHISQASRYLQFICAFVVFCAVMGLVAAYTWSCTSIMYEKCTKVPFRQHFDAVMARIRVERESATVRTTQQV